jgi:transposase
MPPWVFSIIKESIYMNNYAAWIGIDWADKKHDFAVRGSNEDIVSTGSFKHSAQSIDVWIKSIRKLFPKGKIAICLEQSKGGLIYALMKYEFIVLYPINPSMLAKYREAFNSSRVKNDPLDAKLLLELGITHPEKLQPLEPEPEETRLLQRLTEHRTKLVDDIKRVGNRITSTLKDYFPEVLEVFDTIYRNIVADFLLTYSTPSDIRRASEEELIKFFRSHSSGSIERIKQKVALLKSATELTADKAVVESSKLFVQALAHQLRAINASIAQYEKEIEKLYINHPDHEIIDSLPGAGPTMGPRLIAALGTNRSRFNSSCELACYAGIAPVIEQSGNQSWTHWRFLCNKHIRQAFIDWSFLSMRKSFWAEAFYASQRAKGKSHSVAIRALAFKWLRIIFVMWKNKQKYCEADYLRALKKSGSPLVKALAA